MEENNEYNLDTELDQVAVNAENKLKVKNRFEKLSEKVILTSKERDEAITKANAEAQARANAEKERDFLKGFSKLTGKYPGASDYQDQILERVNKGYDQEEAVIAVLGKEGKLPNMETPRPQQTIAGGSAPTTQGGTKSLSEMTSAEKLSALAEADASGELVNALRGL